MSDIKVKSLDLKLEKGHAVCFDFDEVIHKYSKGWQDGSIYDEYNKNVLDLMLFLQKAEIPIFICSTREPYQIINWWNKQGFWCDAVEVKSDETFWKSIKYIGVTNRKLPAQLYIDDRAYKYTGQTVKQFILDNSTIMKADKIFENLGYKKITENKNIKYENKRNPFRIFEFLMDKQVIKLNDVDLLTKKRLQAINKKVEELGWIKN